MLESARKKYNEAFSEEQYQTILAEIEKEFQGQVDFRIAESPVFIDKEFKTKLLITANTLIDFIKKPNFKALTEAAIPEKFYFKNESEFPHFIAIDFAVTQAESGEFEPQLIELQGFPSIFAFQHYLSSKFKKFGKVEEKLSPYFNRLNAFSYLQELEKLLCPDQKKKTILLELFPEQQKTRIDFVLTKSYWDIDSVCLSNVYAKENVLYYEKNGEEIRIDRIYNRIIFDEIEQKFPKLIEKVSILQTADVEWITNPNWFYRVSKFILPYLKGKGIPEAFFLDKLESLPEDLENYVLKPLFSFAGSGVDIHPSKEKIDRIEHKNNFIIQRKVQYVPFIETTDQQKVKAEIRLLFTWPDGKAHPKLVTSLARLSKGEMIGVSANKVDTWVGGTAVFYETI